MGILCFETHLFTRPSEIKEAINEKKAQVAGRLLELKREAFNKRRAIEDAGKMTDGGFLPGDSQLENQPTAKKPITEIRPWDQKVAPAIPTMVKIFPEKNFDIPLDLKQLRKVCSIYQEANEILEWE